MSIASLPKNILAEICSNLEPQDLYNLRRTNKSIRAFLTDADDNIPSPLPKPSLTLPLSLSGPSQINTNSVGYPAANGATSPAFALLPSDRPDVASMPTASDDELMARKRENRLAARMFRERKRHQQQMLEEELSPLKAKVAALRAIHSDLGFAPVAINLPCRDIDAELDRLHPKPPSPPQNETDAPLNLDSPTRRAAQSRIAMWAYRRRKSKLKLQLEDEAAALKAEVSELRSQISTAMIKARL
ncbi:hypothetical protein DFH09DRAFT_1196531 [Mycena vulgaris]|nr:hypothetical protein DFH09DRAFT_1196531 [Mycena vulgaris]